MSNSREFNLWSDIKYNTKTKVGKYVEPQFKSARQAVKRDDKLKVNGGEPGDQVTKMYVNRFCCLCELYLYRQAGSVTSTCFYSLLV